MSLSPRKHRWKDKHPQLSVCKVQLNTFTISLSACCHGDTTIQRGDLAVTSHLKPKFSSSLTKNAQQHSAALWLETVLTCDTSCLWLRPLNHHSLWCHSKRHTMSLFQPLSHSPSFSVSLTHSFSHTHTHTLAASLGLKGYWLLCWRLRPIRCKHLVLGFSTLLPCGDSAAWPTFNLHTDAHTHTHKESYTQVQVWISMCLAQRHVGSNLNSFINS